MSTTTTRPPGSQGSATPLRHLWPHAGVRLFAAYWLSLAAVDATDGPTALLAVALVVVACAARQPWPVALVVAVEGWLFLVGFESNRGGLLAPHDTDLPRLLVVAAVATLAARRTHPVRPVRPVPPVPRGDR